MFYMINGDGVASNGIISGTSDPSFGDINIGNGSAVTVTLGGSISADTLDIASNAVLDTGSDRNIDVSGDVNISGTFNANGSTVNLGGDWDNNGTFNAGTSTLTFDGTSAQNIYSGGLGATKDFYNVTISNTNNTVTATNEQMKLGGALTVGANTSFTLADDTQVWIDGGSLTLNGTPVYAARSAIIDHNGNTYSYYGGASGIDKSLLLSDFDPSDNVYIKRGIFTQDASAVSGALRIESGATYTMGAGNLDVNGSLTINGTLNGSKQDQCGP